MNKSDNPNAKPRKQNALTHFLFHSLFNPEEDMKPDFDTFWNWLMKECRDFSELARANHNRQ